MKVNFPVNFVIFLQWLKSSGWFLLFLTIAPVFRYPLNGGRVLSICSDFLNVAVPLFGKRLYTLLSYILCVGCVFQENNTIFASLMYKFLVMFELFLNTLSYV